MFKDVQSLVDDHESLYTVSFNTCSLTARLSYLNAHSYPLQFSEPADQW